MFAKAIRRKKPPRNQDNKDESYVPQKPGEVISVDQLVSPTPGLIAQMTGFLTGQRYKYATVYVDQYSKRSFVWLQKTASTVETLEGKMAFEQAAKDLNIQIE